VNDRKSGLWQIQRPLSIQKGDKHIPAATVPVENVLIAHLPRQGLPFFEERSGDAKLLQ
jgi:hypothetical protein